MCLNVYFAVGPPSKPITDFIVPSIDALMGINSSLGRMENCPKLMAIELEILLMEEIRLTTYNGINFQPQLVIAGFLNHQQWGHHPLAIPVRCGILRNGFENWPQWMRAELWLGILSLGLSPIHKVVKCSQKWSRKTAKTVEGVFFLILYENQGGIPQKMKGPPLVEAVSSPPYFSELPLIA